VPDATSRAAMFDKWWSFGSQIVAPATLLTSLLFYFGYVSSRAQFRYFGLDVDTVGLSTQDYVMRSPQALLVPMVFLGLATIEGQFVTPIIVGRRMSLSPMVIVVALLIGDWMWGVVGLLIAVPVLAVLKILCSHDERMVPIAELLGQD